MKKVLLIVCSVLLMMGCAADKKEYIPGTYIGIAEGYLNTVEVAVTVDEHYILKIEVLRSEDPKILMDAVLKELPQKIIKKNGTTVEGVSGATFSSESLIQAVDLALEQAIIDE